MNRGLALAAAVLLSALFVALGFWQFARAQVKESQRLAYARALTAPAAALAVGVDDGAPAPQRARGVGVFDPQATLLLDNQILDGRAGVHVLSLFRPSGGRRAVLVDRGWIALAPDRSAPAFAPAASEPVEIGGLLMPPPATGIRLGDAHAERGSARLVNYLDVQTIAQDFGVPLYDGVLLLDPDAPFGFERRWQALPNTMPPERHRAYALQWLALAAATWITFGVLMWRRRNP